MAGEAPTPIPGWALSPRSRGSGAALVARLARPSSWLLIAACAGLGARLLFRSAFWRARTSAHQELGAENPIPWRTAAVGFVLFAGFAGLQTWPLVTDVAHLSRNDNADTILNEWILAWMAHQLPRDPSRLFSANIFHPEPYSLALSEPLVVQGVLGAPMFWLGASPVLVYNLVLLDGLTQTGCATA